MNKHLLEHLYLYFPGPYKCNLPKVQQFYDTLGVDYVLKDEKQNRGQYLSLENVPLDTFHQVYRFLTEHLGAKVYFHLSIK